MNKIFSLIILLSVSFFAKSQINFDYTDSLVNQQKQYIIRFDVANGNIYVPVKKKFRTAPDSAKIFKRDLIKIKDSVYVPLYKDTIVDGKIVRWKYNILQVKNPEFRGDNDIRYLVAGRYFKPRVDGFIRMVFENVPKDQDVKVSVDFLDKNLESAATFSNYLNSYGNMLTNAVNKETGDTLVKTIEKKKDSIDAVQRSTQQSILNTAKKKMDTIVGDKMKIVVSLANILKDAINHYTTVIGRTKTNTKNEISAVKIEIDSLTLEIKDFISSEISITNNDSATVTNLKNRVINFLTNKLEKLNNVSEEFKSIKLYDLSAQSEKIADTIDKLKEQISRFKEAIDSTYGTQIKLLSDTIAFYKKTMDSTVTTIRDSVYNRHTINIHPIQVANTDLTVINVEYLKLGSDPIRRTIVLKNKAGFKLDFSTGFLGTHLKDENYRLFTRGDSSAIVQDYKGSFTIGFAFIAHAYVRTGSRFNPAIVSGFALNGSNQTVNYLLGGFIPFRCGATFYS